MSEDATRREESLRRKSADVERKLGALSGQLMFGNEIGRLAGRQGRLAELAASLDRVRTRGHRYSNELEPQLAAARAAAPQALADARAESEAAAHRLRSRVDEAAREARALAREAVLSAHVHRVESLEREAEALEKATREAEQRIAALAKPFTDPFDGVERRLTELHRVLDAFDQRSFNMVPEESPVAAVPVTWLDPPDGEKMEGLLLLSDHRLRFEQREERVTKRKLLIFAAEKEKIQKCWIDEPIGHLKGSRDEAKGFLVKDQLLTLEWASPARAPRSTAFELESGRAKDLDALVESVLSGDLASQRWSGATAQVEEARLEFPSRCDNCGAVLDPSVKGQTVLRCGYCGRSYQGRPGAVTSPPPT